MAQRPLRALRLAFWLAACAFLFVACSDSRSGPSDGDLDGDGVLDSKDVDVDGDGVGNAEDAFPRNPLEFYDSDRNGVGNLLQADEDGDGVADANDAFPRDGARSSAPVVAESGFNDNLGAANATVPSLVGASSPPASLTPEDRATRIQGVVESAFDTDVYLVVPPASDAVSFVLRAASPALSVDGLRIGIVDLDGRAIRTTPLRVTGPERHVGVWGRFGDRVLGLVVSDGNGAAVGLAYEIVVCRDSDADGVDDDREVALGMRRDAADSDGDGLTDLDESGGVASWDPDRDGAPSWLDRDSDGDGIPDAVEGAIDTDRDGAPNFVDGDADGNGVADDEEPARAGSLADYDCDGVADAFDRDDDDDGVEDVDDAAPRSPAGLLADGAGTLSGRDWWFYGLRIQDMARAGGSMRLRGADLGSTPTTRFRAQVSQPTDRRGLSWATAPLGVTGGELVFDLPSTAADGSVRLLDVGAGRVTRALPMRVVGARHPVLLTTVVRRAIGQTVYLDLLDGPASADGVFVEINGVPVAPASVTTNQIVFVVPPDAHPGELRVIGPFGATNAASLTVTRLVTGSITFPAGSTAATAALTLAADAVAVPLSLGTSRSFLTMMAANVPALVSACRTAEGGALLLAVSDPASSACALDVASTAVALAWLRASVDGGGRPDAVASAALLQAVRAAAGLPGLVQELGAALVADPDALANLPASVRSRVDAVALAASGALPSVARGATPAGMTITPAESHGFALAVDAASTRLKVDNDTMLYASAAWFEVDASGQVVAQRTQHLRNRFDLRIVRPQDGAPFFQASETPVGWTPSTHAILQLVTAGSVGNASRIPIDAAARDAVVARTLLSQVVVPVVALALGMFVPDERVLAAFLVEALDPAINAALTAYTTGASTLLTAAYTVVQAVIADLSKPLSGQESKILTAILRHNGLQLDLAGLLRISRAAVKRLMLVYSVGLASASVTAVVADIATTPVGLDFAVDRALRIDAIEPARAVNYHYGTPEWDLQLELAGAGMVPGGGYAAWQAAPGLVQVEIGDVSRAARSIRADGTRTVVVLGQQDVQRLRPDSEAVKVVVDSGFASDPIELRVYDRPVVDRMTPSSGRTGDVVEIEGIGFDPRAPGANEVVFTGVGDPVYGSVLNVTSDGRRLIVRVPVEVASGPVFVRCDRPDGFTVESNEVEFTAASSVITFWDSGSLKDDIFSLWLDGDLLHMPGEPVWPEIAVEAPLRTMHDHTVELRGVSAPDEIGTYSIAFGPEVEVLPGSDPLTGSDLVAGAVKTFHVRIGARAAFRAAPDIDRIEWWEPVARRSR